VQSTLSRFFALQVDAGGVISTVGGAVGLVLAAGGYYDFAPLAYTGHTGPRSTTALRSPSCVAVSADDGTTYVCDGASAVWALGGILDAPSTMAAVQRWPYFDLQLFLPSNVRPEWPCAGEGGSGDDVTDAFNANYRIMMQRTSVRGGSITTRTAACRLETATVTTYSTSADCVDSVWVTCAATEAGGAWFFFLQRLDANGTVYGSSQLSHPNIAAIAYPSAPIFQSQWPPFMLIGPLGVKAANGTDVVSDTIIFAMEPWVATGYIEGGSIALASDVSFGGYPCNSVTVVDYLTLICR